ncbi:MAG: tetratricopeptide repeat protein [Candidatus Latescibacterota bacterium]|nr:MAG: tetratricopeptide repeat protein [Candidatus Latescibacterota bacterium]
MINPTRLARAAALTVAVALLAAVGLHPTPLRADTDTEALLQELEGKSPEERLRLLKITVDEGRSSKEIYFHLGNAYFAVNDVQGAILAFGKALELDPQYFKAAVNLALMYDEQESYPRALEVFELAASIEPENPDVWSHMGNTYYAQGNYAKAMELYRKALALDADATHALYSVGVAFADAGIFREAVRYWTRVSALEPESELGRSAAENVELLNRYLIPR